MIRSAALGYHGKPLVAVDLAEVNHTPIFWTVTARSLDDHQAVDARSRPASLDAELAN
jgi:hypothetical protein